MGDFLAWLDAQEEAQAKKQDHEEPAFTTEQVSEDRQGGCKAVKCCRQEGGVGVIGGRRQHGGVPSGVDTVSLASVNRCRSRLEIDAHLAVLAREHLRNCAQA